MARNTPRLHKEAGRKDQSEAELTWYRPSKIHTWLADTMIWADCSAGKYRPDEDCGGK